MALDSTRKVVQLSDASGNIASQTSNAVDVNLKSITAGSVPINDNSGLISVDDGGGSITVDNGGTFVVQATLAAGATAIAKAEDVASANADVGVPAMAVQKATPANTAGTDGDYEFLQMSAGRLWVSATVDTALPAGTAAIGKLAANSGVDIGDVDITSIVPGVAATSLGKAEDAVHGSGDTGVMALAVRSDAQTVTAADGDYVPLLVNASGALYVTGGGGGTQYVEDAAAASDPTGTAVILVRKDTPSTTVTADGDNIAQRGTNYGAAYVTLLDTGGSPVSVGGGTQYTEDAAAAGDPIGNAIIVVRKDTPSTIVSADGDNIALRGTNYGAVYVTILDGNGAVVGGATQYTEDAAAASDPVGNAVMLVRKDTPAATVSADSDNIAQRGSDYGAAYVTLVGTTGTRISDATQSGAIDVAIANNPGLIVRGSLAHDAAYTTADNPVMAGGFASAAAPTDVSADGDVVHLWALRSGALATQPTYGGVLAVAGNGVAGTGVQRVTVASDSTGNIATIGTSVTPGTSAAHLGKAEDAAHSSGDTGVMVLGVRAAAPTERSAGPTDGDYEPLGINEVGAVWVSETASANGGVSTMNATSSDGATALTNSAQAIKASAGNLYGYYIYNPNSSAQFVQFYNTASGSVTVGTTNPLFMLTIPATSGANLWTNCGIAFGTAMSWAATSTAGGNGAPATALDAVAWYK